MKRSSPTDASVILVPPFPSSSVPAAEPPARASSDDPSAKPTSPNTAGGSTTFSLGERSVKPKEALGTITLLALLYSHVSGSAFGSEEAVGAGGAMITIIAIFALPFIQGIPFSLAVTELSAAIPSNAGYLMWFNLAFHPIVYFTALQMSILNNVVDTALYPVIFSEYTCKLFECGTWSKAAIKLLLLVLSGVLNAVGVEFVGIGSVIITILSLAPFYILFVWQGVKGGFNWSRVSEIRSDVKWSVFLPTISWNFCGQESMGAVVEEVTNPQKTLIRAVFPLVVMLWLTYIPPIITSVSAQTSTDWSVWTNGFYATTAETIAGDFGKYIMIIGGMVSAVGLTMSAICVCSRLIAGMGQAEAFPRKWNAIVSYHSPRFQTPVIAIAINTVAAGVATITLDFEKLVGIDQVTYGITIILIFLALIRLRLLYPTLERPFKIPLSTSSLVKFSLLPIGYSLVLCAVALVVDWLTVWLCVGMIGSFVVISVIYVKLFRPLGFAGKIRVKDSPTSSPTASSDVREPQDDDREEIGFHEPTTRVPSA